MPAAPCHWTCRAKGTIFLAAALAKCEEAEGLGLNLNHAGAAGASLCNSLALACIQAAVTALLACLVVAVAIACGAACRHCRDARREARKRRSAGASTRSTLVGQARLDRRRAGSDIPSAAAQSAAAASRSTVQAASTSTQTDLSIAPDELWPVMTSTSLRSSASSRRARPNSDPSDALAKTTSRRALSKSDSCMATARTAQVLSVTSPTHASRASASQSPAAAGKTSAKPGDDKRSFTQLAVSFAPEPSPSSPTTQEPRRRPSQRRSPQGPDETPTPAATRMTISKSAPNIKLSSGALFLAEMVRRQRERQETGPETPVRTPVLPPRSAWSAEARAYIEACEGQGGQDEALAPRRRGMQAGVRNAGAATSPGQGQSLTTSRTRSTIVRETKSAPPPQHAAAGSGEVRRTGTA